VLYSGTVAGALEAVINGMPAVALSLDIPANGLWHFSLASEVAIPIIDSVIAKGLPAWTALNVNIPNLPQAQLKGTKLTTHGKSGFKEYYVEENAEGTRRRFRLEGAMEFRDTNSAVDAVALREGWISATPLGLSMESSEGMAKLKNWELFSNKPF
jgi:5'-nucleotidase